MWIKGAKNEIHKKGLKKIKKRKEKDKAKKSKKQKRKKTKRFLATKIESLT